MDDFLKGNNYSILFNLFKWFPLEYFSWGYNVTASISSKQQTEKCFRKFFGWCINIPNSSFYTNFEIWRKTKMFKMATVAKVGLYRNAQSTSYLLLTPLSLMTFPRETYKKWPWSAIFLKLEGFGSHCDRCKVSIWVSLLSSFKKCLEW